MHPAQVLPLLALLWVLSACGGPAFDRAYVAAGQGQAESDLRPSSQFSTTDDLNVVIKLNRHGGNLPVAARFLDPNGEEVQTVRAEVPEGVETVVLGIDADLRPDPAEQWVRGRYTVEVEVNGEVVERLFFRVD
ncbi:MAG: hypothetical protein HC915_16880 [Anaerolineae bacterium]|nr:hypothetical protein [Anaerolineae bacterium]